jgi:hypothetical protein
MTDELVLAIGRLEGKLDAHAGHLQRMEDKMDGIDTRTRAVEVSSAKSGAVAGGIAGVMMALGVDFLRAKLFGP